MFHYWSFSLCFYYNREQNLCLLHISFIFLIYSYTFFISIWHFFLVHIILSTLYMGNNNNLLDKKTYTV